jgi:hypothetical protein
LPFQNNGDENIGPFPRDKNTLNVQSVIPTQLTHKWNLISLIITPVVARG